MTPDLRTSLPQMLATGVERWWSQDVPVLFPTYLAARLGTTRFAPLWQAVALAAATVPAVPILESLGELQEGRMPASYASRVFVWANLQNPGLVALPLRALAAGYLAVFATGLLAGLPERHPSPLAPPPLDVGRLAGDAMNWSAVLLAAALVAVLLGALIGPAPWLKWVEPLSAAPPYQAPLMAAAIATNGAVLLAAELALAARAGLFWPRLLAWRAIAAVLAATITWALSAI